jgi:ubiquinone biosynthesis protein
MLLTMRLDQTISSFARLRQIANTLVRHGLSMWVDRTRLRYFLSIGGLIRRMRPPKQAQTLPQRLRTAMEELGPTFIKLGQMLSMRPDMIPLTWALEFSKLQDSTPAFPSDQAISIIESELEKPIAELFATFNPEPIACASLAQVHDATLFDGTQVVVKVRRPRIEHIIEADLVIMRDLADYLGNYVQQELFSPLDVVDEFALNIHRELDFNLEAGNIERLHRNMEKLDYVKVPTVIWSHSTSSVLTMTKLNGIKLANLTPAMNIDKALVSQRLVKCFLTQVFDDAYFHADPHPGNILFEDDNSIGILDCGMMGQIGPHQLDHLAGLMVAIVQKETGQVVEEFLQLTDYTENINWQLLEADASHLINRFWGMPLENIDLTGIFNEVLLLGNRHHLRVSAEFTMLARMVVILESFARQLNPDLNIIEISTPIVTRLVQRRYSPAAFAKRAGEVGIEYVRFASELPRELRTITRKISRGRLGLEIQHKGLEPMQKELERGSRRIALSMVTAALIIGSSFVMTTGQYPRILGYPWLGFVGFALAAIFALGIIISLMRRR